MIEREITELSQAKKSIPRATLKIYDLPIPLSELADT